MHGANGGERVKQTISYFQYCCNIYCNWLDQGSPQQYLVFFPQDLHRTTAS